jgi:hypothetical protein
MFRFDKVAAMTKLARLMQRGTEFLGCETAIVCRVKSIDD